MSAFWNLVKLGLIGIYGAAAVSKFVPGLAGASNILIGLAIVLLAIHLIEFWALRGKLHAAAPDRAHFIPTFLFGVAHSMPILGAGKS